MMNCMTDTQTVNHKANVAFRDLYQTRLQEALKPTLQELEQASLAQTISNVVDQAVDLKSGMIDVGLLDQELVMPNNVTARLMQKGAHTAYLVEAALDALAAQGRFSNALDADFVATSIASLGMVKCESIIADCDIEDATLLDDADYRQEAAEEAIQSFLTELHQANSTQHSRVFEYVLVKTLANKFNTADSTLVFKR